MQGRNAVLPDALFAEFSDFLAARMGLSCPKERRGDLERALTSAAGELEFRDAEACARWFLTSPATRAQVEILASHLTVGETYFFREPRSYEIAENHIVTELIRSRQQRDQRLRIWSAGCATGEEPYSIAILLDKLLSDIEEWNITILATDINPRFLQKAGEGTYTEWSFRGVPAWVREKYFMTDQSGRFHILPRIKRMVTFSYLNLAEDTYPALANGTNAMDLICCRNVLMYFTRPCAKRVIHKLHHCLVDGGWLMVSPVEMSHDLFSSFAAVGFPDAALYRKTPESAQQIPTLEVPSEAPAFTPVPAFSPQRGRNRSPSSPMGDEAIGTAQGEGVPAASEHEKGTGPVSTPYDEALALYRQGQYGEAADKIANLIVENPGDARAMELLARARANQGSLAEAREWCEKAIAQDKLNAGYHYLLATIEQECGRHADAAASLKRALYLDHNFALAHFAIGNLARLQGRARESEKHYANALSALNAYRPEDILPESEGLTAGRLAEIIRSMSGRRAAA